MEVSNKIGDYLVTKALNTVSDTLQVGQTYLYVVCIFHGLSQKRSTYRVARVVYDGLGHLSRDLKFRGINNERPFSIATFELRNYGECWFLVRYI